MPWPSTAQRPASTSLTDWASQRHHSAMPRIACSSSGPAETSSRSIATGAARPAKRPLPWIGFAEMRHVIEALPATARCEMQKPPTCLPQQQLERLSAPNTAPTKVENSSNIGAIKDRYQTDIERGRSKRGSGRKRLELSKYLGHASPTGSFGRISTGIKTVSVAACLCAKGRSSPVQLICSTWPLSGAVGDDPNDPPF